MDDFIFVFQFKIHLALSGQYNECMRICYGIIGDREA